METDITSELPRLTKCTSCSRLVVVGVTPRGTRIQFDPEPVRGGEYVIDGHGAATAPTKAQRSEMLYSRHVLTCPFAESIGARHD